LGEDLARLCPDDPLVKELVLAGYEPAREALRHEILRASVADHGKLLVEIRWRVGRIHASQGGGERGGRVAVLALYYPQGAEVGGVPLRARPDGGGRCGAAGEEILS